MPIPSQRALNALEYWINGRIKHATKVASPIQWNQELEDWALCVHNHCVDPADPGSSFMSGHHDIPPIPLVVGFLTQVVADYKNTSVKNDPDKAKTQAAIIKLIVGQQQTGICDCSRHAEKFGTSITVPDQIYNKLK